MYFQSSMDERETEIVTIVSREVVDMDIYGSREVLVH